MLQSDLFKLKISKNVILSEHVFNNSVQDKVLFHLEEYQYVSKPKLHRSGTYPLNRIYAHRSSTVHVYPSSHCPLYMLIIYQAGCMREGQRAGPAARRVCHGLGAGGGLDWRRGLEGR